MICKIADLIVKIPTAGGLPSRCRAYRLETEQPADMEINESDYRLNKWPDTPYETVSYMESGWNFYVKLLSFFGFGLHASALEYEGNAYLFSGPSTVGKSTHTRLWQKAFGSGAQVFNDDKPALRLIDGKWYAYGTPWCGKDGINQNRKVPLTGICFLRQAHANKIRRLSAQEAIPMILSQTTRKITAENMERLLSLVEKIVQDVPIYLLENKADEEAARLSYTTMSARDEKVKEP